ncbi:MAG: sporulation protein [Comamonadaceae bacterium CG_4_9_14_3_um_filter_60_33]|nr:MAG: sporulation protein [Comamonadaceae bacterium CG2_30_59_20]PIY27808.1 MAG: sporulation protein [Comamonadaceae bacterium CG_4_10_14_3_um_filter_60_42]PJB45803.1 MAG: sporulation protein [Comamonadaceae bacterium CG_4_9_14_3_um_filter_60_33]
MQQQRGSTLLGFIIGLLVGLGVALAVAVYVTKVPILFFNKTAGRNADQDANEIEKNKNWDPNAPLYGKNPARSAAPIEPVVPAPEASNEKNQAAVSADPLGDLANARTQNDTVGEINTAPDPFTYFIQVGAYRTPEDAQTQRAKLLLSGIETKITEREQSGRTIYRVRVGPFDNRAQADAAKTKLDAAGIETALVRVQR